MKRVFYHANCADGMAAMTVLRDWLEWQGNVFKQDFKCYPLNYGGYLPELLEVADGDEIYFVDFSPKNLEEYEVFKQLVGETGKVTIWDHHKTALIYKDLPNVVIDLNESGASLTFKMIYGDKAEVPPFIQYIRDRDLWLWQLPESREISAAVWSYKMAYEIWRDLLSSDGHKLNRLADEGKAILRYMQVQVSAICDRAIVTSVTSPIYLQNIPIANATNLFSEVGEELLNRYQTAPFSAYWFLRADGKIQVGLRSREFDVSVFAKLHGGGGHKNAAGFECSVNEFNNIFDLWLS